MKYSPAKFADELEVLLENRVGISSCKDVADWAYKTRLNNISDMDPRVKEWLLQLGAMSMGPEFQLSEGELRKFIEKARTL